MAVIEEDNKQVFQPTAGEDVRLENLGYEQGANTGLKWIDYTNVEQSSSGPLASWV